MTVEERDKVRIIHLIDAVEIVKDYLKNSDFKSFESNKMLQDACLRQLSIIGEACSRISAELKTKYPNIKWKQIIGLRNIVIHEYFGVDILLIWNVLKYDLPELEQEAKIILDSF